MHRFEKALQVKDSRGKALTEGLRTALEYLTTDDADFDGFDPEVVREFKAYAKTIAGALDMARGRIQELEGLATMH
jgi:hypothetical protein